MRSLWLVLGLVVACGGGDDERHPAAPEQGGTNSSGGTGGSRAGSTSKSDAGQAGEGEPTVGGGGEAVGGAAGEPGIIYEMGGRPQLMPGVCDPMLELGAAEAQDVGVSGATLLSMTSDELSVAFSTGEDDALVLHVGDRASSAADFTSVIVTLPEGYTAAKGVSLSSDGRLLILVRDDDAGFAELSRASRTVAFGSTANETRFARINAQKPMSGQSVGWPVITEDGKTLYYVSYFGASTVWQAKLVAGDFNIGKNIDPFTLGGDEDERKLLSGVSADQRTIFFFDEATSHSTALFRSRTGDDVPFYDPIDLGERRGVAPNLDCSRVYSSTDTGIVVQTPE